MCRMQGCACVCVCVCLSVCVCVCVCMYVCVHKLWPPFRLRNDQWTPSIQTIQGVASESLTLISAFCCLSAEITYRRDQWTLRQIDDIDSIFWLKLKEGAAGKNYLHIVFSPTLFVFQRRSFWQKWTVSSLSSSIALFRCRQLLKATILLLCILK